MTGRVPGQSLAVIREERRQSKERRSKCHIWRDTERKRKKNDRKRVEMAHDLISRLSQFRRERTRRTVLFPEAQLSLKTLIYSDSALVISGERRQSSEKNAAVRPSRQFTFIPHPPGLHLYTHTQLLSSHDRHCAAQPKADWSHMVLVNTVATMILRRSTALHAASQYT